MTANYRVQIGLQHFGGVDAPASAHSQQPATDTTTEPRTPQ